MNRVTESNTACLHADSGRALLILLLFVTAASCLAAMWVSEGDEWVEVGARILAGPLYPLWLEIEDGMSASGVAFLAMVLGAPPLLVYGGFRTDRALLLAAGGVLWVAEGYLFGVAIWLV